MLAPCGVYQPADDVASGASEVSARREGSAACVFQIQPLMSSLGLSGACCSRPGYKQVVSPADPSYDPFFKATVNELMQARLPRSTNPVSRYLMNTIYEASMLGILVLFAVLVILRLPDL